MHSPLQPDNSANNELSIGGIRVGDLARRVGSTPFYAYDRSMVTERIVRIRKAMPEAVKIHYAVKANPMYALIHHLSGLVDGFDVASAQELKAALDTGMPAKDISFAGPGKTDWELERAVAAGVDVSVESKSEIRRLRQVGERMGVAPRVLVRVNPSFSIRNSGMTMAGGAKQFGIDEEQCQSAFAMIGEAGMVARGVQVFWGSQNLHAGSIASAQRETLAIVGRLSRAAGIAFEVVNIGGGYGVPYSPGSEELDLEEVGRCLAESLEQHLPALGEPEVVIELGRYITAEAGFYVCKVIDVKTSRGQKYVVTDGGLHHHLSASGNFGQSIRKNFPIRLAAEGIGGEPEEVHVVGCLCTPIDLLGHKVLLPRVQEGDLLVVLQSGAYGPSASPVNFISHPHPVEVVV
ncbi:MAG: pyridoxal-dependent decarboxylase, exosortase A system-associated [Alphaproteobacteria bacterium]|jgi:diaminopimelate decarboxylase|nr:pyridoxal-dependent decarboxylase, exosortase A system-associated [Alphaproteobacteria bacterium]MBU1550115.1 pyridoxal-dependent decarboxylase, exosortase A system-associated [Alphaproteobacteria bacterium]MBU2337083.1 pyridoxal-dependent decarboxylase, exosortase A system-associated [Alphaproteobacteria bacterium]MBU2389414.1 pyridoxal-dependent decarboxylase, exosortase A system-associated [Alphaproteobacteria bacterium]